MTFDSDVRPAACSEYESLLDDSRLALEAWKEGRTEIRQSGRKGRAIDDQLRILQANFARAYARLQAHARYCDICQMPALVHPGYGINPLPTNYPLHQ
jgi:hypothetical protein